MPAVLRLSKTLRPASVGPTVRRGSELGPIVIRPYLGPPDALRWVQIQDEALARQRGGRPRTEADFRRQWLTQSWWQPDRLLFACLDTGGSQFAPADILGTVGADILGTVGFRPVTSTTAHLFWLAVRPRCQRRGVGRLLVEAVERQCVVLGVRRLQAETLPEWSTAVAFYLALGFSID